MKLKITFWLIVAVCCAALGIGQKQHVSTVWREYKTLWWDYEYKDRYTVLYKPHISKTISQSDPEAVAIAEVILSRYENDNERLLSSAEHLLRFPQNEFLLCELAERLFYNNALDPNIRTILAERLVSLNPKKPFYHYLLADALLAAGNVNLVLDEVEHGNHCIDYNRPYDQYKQRVVNLAEKAKLGQMIIRELDYERFTPHPHDLDRKLINLANASFADGDNLLGTRICDAVYEMQRKYILTGNLKALAINNLNMLSSFVNFGHWYCPEALELQRVDLSKERAKENRIRLCSRIPENALADSEKTYNRGQTEIKDERKADVAYIALMLASHFGEMFVSLGLTVITILLLCLLYGYSKRQRAGFVKMLLFALACLVFLLVTKVIYVREVIEFPCCHSSYTEILRPPRISPAILVDEPVLVLIFIIAPLSVLLLLQISKKGRWWARLLFLTAVFAVSLSILTVSQHLEHELFLWEDLLLPMAIVVCVLIALTLLARWLCRWKIVWLLVAALFFGSLSIIAQGYFYFELVVMLVFILFSAITIIGPSPKDRSPIASLFTLSDADPHAMALRSGCLKLLSLFIAVYWLVFIGLMPASAYRINYEIGQYLPPVKIDYTLPEPNETAYQKVLDYVEYQKMPQYTTLNIIGLVMPEDLPGVLEKIKATQTNPYEYFGPLMDSRRSRGYRGVSGEPNLINILLTRAITSSGRDVANIITAAITDPNHPRTLLARAKLGDYTAKLPLEKLLAIRIAEGNDFPYADTDAHLWSRPLTSAEIIHALACVSEPNEATQRYLEYIRRSSLYDLGEEAEFRRSVVLLPTQQAQSVIKAYITRAQQLRHTEIPLDIAPFSVPCPQNILHRLETMLGNYSDREIAEEVFRLMLLTDEEGQKVPLIDVPLHFTSESAELLKRGLAARDDNLRAWSLWQLRNISYEFTNEETAKLVKDKSWMVRADAIVAEPKKTKNIATNDKNFFVRFVATLYPDSL